MSQTKSKVPVFLAIAQVRHETTEDFNDKFEDIAKALKSIQFVDVQKFVQPVFVFQVSGSEGQNPSSQSPIQQALQIVAYDIPQTAAIIVDANNITLYEAAYPTGHSPFVDKLMIAVEAIHKVAPMNLVVRTGLRYLDSISDDATGLSLREALHPGIVAFFEPLKDGVPLNTAVSQWVMQKDSITATARALIAHQGPAMPVDINTMQLRIEPKLQSISVLNATIDTDVGHDQRERFDLLKIRESFELIHPYVRQLFDRITTSKARKHWGIS